MSICTLVTALPSMTAMCHRICSKRLLLLNKGVSRKALAFEINVEVPAVVPMRDKLEILVSDANFA